MSQTNIQDVKKLAAEGKLKEALQLGKVLLQQDPDSSELRSSLMEIQDAMMLQIQVDAILQKAEEASKTGQKETAFKMLKEIFAIDPENPKAAAMQQSLSGDAAPLAPAASTPGASDVVSLAGEGAEFLESDFEETELLSGPVEPPTGDAVTREELPELNTLEPLDIPEETETTDPERTLLSVEGDMLGPEEKLKVREYIEKGRKLLDSGNYEEAIDAWNRVFIIDETNSEAQELIDAAKETINKRQKDIEPLLTEGISAYNSGDFDKSREILEKILAAFPSHREALYYLDQIKKKSSKKRTQEADEFQLIQPEDEAPQRAPAEGDEGNASEFVFGDADSEQERTAPSTEPSTETASEGEPNFVFEENAPESMSTGFTPEEQTDQEVPFTVERSSYSYDDSTVGGEHDVTEGSDESGDSGFVLETNEVDDSSFSFDAAPAGGFELETGAAEDFSAPTEPTVAETTIPETPLADSVSVSPAAAPEPASSAEVIEPGEGVETPMETSTHAGKAPKLSGGLIIGLAAVGLLIIGLGIFFAARFFIGGHKGNEPPKNQPKSTKPRKPSKPAVKEPEALPIKPPPKLTVQELSAKAKEAYSAGDYAGALALYRKILDRGGTQSPQIIADMQAAQMAYTKQNLEEQKKAKFLKEFGYAEKSCTESDYPEALRVAWRLIYPDDSMARKLGKRERINDIIKISYFNWAVSDLKKENVSGAIKNFNDLLDFSPHDTEATKILNFIKKYKEQRADEAYWAYVSIVRARQLPPVKEPEP